VIAFIESMGRRGYFGYTSLCDLNENKALQFCRHLHQKNDLKAPSNVLYLYPKFISELEI